MRRFVALLVVAACSRSADSPVVVSVPTTTTTPPTKTPGPSLGPTAGPRSEVGLAREKTARGADVFAIGNPRFRLVPRCCEPLVVRAGSGRVVATDRNEVKVWTLADGKLVRRESVSSSLSPLIEVVASGDGDWLAMGDSNVVRFYRRDVQVATLKGLRVRSFVGSSQVLADGTDGAALVDPTSGKIVSRLPAKPFVAGASTLALAGDGEHVWWITRRGFARWSIGASNFTIVTAGKEWASASVALRAPVAVVRREDGLYRLDLASGSFDRFSARGVIYAVSPDGARCAIVGVNKVEVVDTMSGQAIATVGGSDKIHRVAFSENDSIFAFDDNGLIRIADIAASKIRVRQDADASRFRGWNSDSSASIQHEGTTQRLDVITQAIGPDRPTLAVATIAPLSIAVTDRAIVATTNGKQVAKLDVGEPPRPGLGLAQTYWKAVGSPNGGLVLVWIRRPDVGPIPEPDETNAKDRSPKCDRDDRGDCILEYVAQLWRVSNPPTLVWETRPNGKRPQLVRPWPYPKAPSLPFAFTPDGKFVLFGFDDGDVIVRSTDAAGTERIEALHRAPITRIEVAPNSTWVFSEDAEGEQRIWPL
jgi:hypothetical protein